MTHRKRRVSNKNVRISKKRATQRKVLNNKKTTVVMPSKSTPVQEVRIVLPNLAILEKEINKTVIGQEAVVKSICTKIYEGMLFPQLKSNILLVGKSGTGKTEIIRQIAANLKLPLTIEDATRYTEDGYVGASVTDIITNLIKEANGNLLLASRGIVFIDEIDKKASRGEFYSEINKGGVLKGLLKIVEGTDVIIPDPNEQNFLFGPESTIKFDTSNIIFIFGGAFEGMDELRTQRLNKRKIGFASAEANQIVINNYLNTSFTKEDLVKYGLPTELVGRVASIYETRELQVKDLRNILDYSRKSEFRKYEKIFKNNGIRLIYSDNLFTLIAENAKKASTGARELNSIVSHMFEKIMYDAFTTVPENKYTQCILSDEIVQDNTKYHWE